MTIGIDCRLWNETGVGRYIRNLVENLVVFDQRNVYILFCLHKDQENLKSRISHPKGTSFGEAANLKRNKENFKIVIADIRWHSIEEQLLLPEILKKENLDLMHFPYFSVPILYNKPFVVTIHDLIIDHYPTGEATTLPPLVYQAKRLGYRYIIQTAAKKARKVITVSHATEEEIIDHLHIPKEKIVVTYEGIDSKMTNSQFPITKYQIPDTRYFLHVGNVYPHKNSNRLIDAFALLLKTHPDIQLIFVGKDDYFFQKLKKKVNTLGLEKSIIFTGLISDEELAAYCHHAEAVIIPSLMEGFGLPAVEAIAQNCLVLASAIPSLKEICEDGALYFDPMKESDIAKCMEKALQLPIAKKKEIIANGRKKIADYSWEKMAKETISIYESSIGV